LIKEEHREAGVALVDSIVGEMELDMSEIEKEEDPGMGGYMLTAEHEGYILTKEERLRKEHELVHRVIHPLFDKTKEQPREHDSKISKEAEEQKRKGQENWQGSVHWQKKKEAMIVLRWWWLSMDQQKEVFQYFHKREQGKRIWRVE
jgi:hypothetical protein